MPIARTPVRLSQARSWAVDSSCEIFWERTMWECEATLAQVGRGASGAAGTERTERIFMEGSLA